MEGHARGSFFSFLPSGGSIPRATSQSLSTEAPPGTGRNTVFRAQSRLCHVTLEHDLRYDLRTLAKYWLLPLVLENESSTTEAMNMDNLVF